MTCVVTHINLGEENSSRKTMFEQLQIWLYAFATLLVTLVAFRKGKLNSPREKTFRFLTVVGVFLPWIDVLETVVGFELFILGCFSRLGTHWQWNGRRWL